MMPLLFGGADSRHLVCYQKKARCVLGPRGSRRGAPVARMYRANLPDGSPGTDSPYLAAGDEA